MYLERNNPEEAENIKILKGPKGELIISLKKPAIPNGYKATANRIKKSGIIDKAITQIGRKIVVDADLALSLAKESGGIHIKE